MLKITKIINDRKYGISRTVYNGLIILLLLSARATKADGQVVSSNDVVGKYSISQKRLLVLSTFQFVNFITQNNLDQDSAMAIACRITNMPFFLAYSEYFADNSAPVGTDLINAGKIPEAVDLLETQHGEKRIRLLLELGVWYLHQPGVHKEDLAKADHYIGTAAKLSEKGRYINWQTECRLLLAELSQQRGNAQESKKIVMEIVGSGSQKVNNKQMVRAWQQLGTLFPNSDSTRLSYISKAIELSRKQQDKEKEIELLFIAANYQSRLDGKSMESALARMLSLMRTTNFRHTLYAENTMAYAMLGQSKYIDALKYAKAGLENMKWSGLEAVSGSFFIRLGAAYEAFDKNEEAMRWFQKALRSGTNETHIFWYKSLFFATTLLLITDKPEECLSLMKTITDRFPPVTSWEKINVLATDGLCYQKLKHFRTADIAFSSILTLVKKDPPADSFGELSSTYYDLADAYLSRRNLKKAKLFLNMATENEQKNDYTNFLKYSLLFRIDSLKGNYKSALRNHVLSKLNYDSWIRMDQRKRMDELTLRFASEKKDRDIKILKQEKTVQQAELKQNKMIRDIVVAGAGLLLIIMVLLVNQFSIKQRANRAINKKNKSLQHLLYEKEWLLKEVHHRVKNNLHTVICLLESQAVYLENDALKAIESSQHRIYAMSLIHQKLYQSDDIKTIDMAVYLPEFIQYLNDSFEVQKRVRFHLEIEHIQLAVSQAIPLALIINEAVTNAIKYAFTGESIGVITISMNQDNREINLVISDNGIGIDPAIINKPQDSLGMKLIRGLSEDINARISFENKRGTRISIVFGVDPLNDSGNFLSPQKNGENSM